MSDRALLAVLEDARARGFLGPGPVGPHVAHARSFLPHVPDDGPCLDLGSGGGIPGLVLAREGPPVRWLLLDAGGRRTTFLAEAVAALGLADRVDVVTGRAEEVGRQDDHRGRFGAVVARSFGPPAVVAECAAPFLRPGGQLVVSEPPGPVVRWPAEGLARLGLDLVALEAGPPALAVLRQVTPCPDRYPRRVGIPSKRPLW